MRGDVMFRKQLEASSVGGFFQFKSAVRAMSPIVTKRTYACALHMSAFDPKRTCDRLSVDPGSVHAAFG